LSSAYSDEFSFLLLHGIRENSKDFAQDSISGHHGLLLLKMSISQSS